MEKLTIESQETKSQNIVDNNVQLLKKAFPEVFTEDGVLFDTLKQLLGEVVDEREEKYGLNWHGKRRAKQNALTPSTGTLIPVPNDGLEWESSQNLLIEGDNLEVLKLLQKSYSGKVKMIYIDPPYNTGKDFVYPDDFRDSIKNYLELTSQTEGGVKLTANTEASGRFHTDWLNMMYPRLKLARSLLREDGAIFISIHYKELANLLHLCNEIFGEENFVGNVTWKSRVKPVNIGEAKYRPQGETEYVVVYQRSDAEGKFQPLYTGGIRSYPYELDGRKYRLTTILKSNRGGNYRTTMSFEIDGYTPPDGQRWQAGEDEIKRLNKEGYIEFKDGTPFRRYFEDEEGAEHDPFYCFMEADWSSTSEAGKSELNDILGNDHGFDTVKPTRLIRTLIQSLTQPENGEIVMDFFAGSGTTMDAVLTQNAEDGGNRKCILVQIPEPLDAENKDQKTAAQFCDQIGKPRSISEITKERIRRVSARIKDKYPGKSGDTGFKVFKLESSNIRSWEPNPDDLAATLLDSEEHIKDGRSEDDILYELLLKLGLDLAVPIENKEIEGKVVHSIGAGALLVCLSESIAREEVEALAMGMIAWHGEQAPAGETTVVFRDSAFADDVAKTNITAILAQNGLTTVRSL
jgi:adenine-specific DNA-methyltransferase